MTNEVNNGDVPNGLYKSETEFDNDHQKISTTDPIDNASRVDENKNVEKSFTSIELDTKRPDDHPTKPNTLDNFMESHKSQIRTLRIFLLNFVIGGYFGWATEHYISKRNSEGCDIEWCDGYGMLLILMIIIYTCLIYFHVLKPLVRKHFGNSLRPMKKNISTFFSNRLVKFGVVGALLAVFVIFIAYDTIGSRDRLRSLLGIVILFGIGYIFSSDRSKIRWRTVLCGVSLQIFMGIFCIRMEIGRNIFECFGRKVATFFDFAVQGSKFVYGDYIVSKLHVFAFSVLPVIFFFSFIVSILYYYGAMQWIIRQLGTMLQSLMGTTVCEGVIAAGNVFLGMTESPLLIKPYMKYLTASEIHLIMASGFATVSGTVLAAYISYGAEASHLITSSVMAAPATLAFAKLIYPETEKSQTSAKNISMEKAKEKTVLDAASNGAFAAIELIAGIIANLIAFVSFVAFLNSLVSWLGMLVGHDYISFEWFFGKLFIPLAYIIGIPWEDCEKIGAVIATKTIINEFVAYERLGELKKNHLISMRSSAIATFAICGFANFSSLGMMIGNLGTMCPEKRSIITSVSVRALISGSIICFLNASIAGLLMNDGIFT